MATNLTAVGIQTTFYGIRDSAGYLMGTTGTLANGADSGMGRLDLSEFNIPTAAATRVPVTANNGVLSSFLIPAQDVAEGQIVAKTMDPTFAATVESMSLYTTDGYDWAIAGAPCPSLKSVTFVQNSPAMNRTSGSLNSPGYVVRIVPNCNVTQRMEAVQTASEQTFPFDVTVNLFDRTPWGVALTTGNYGTTSGTHFRPFWSPAPVTMHSFVGDNSDTAFTLNETPYAASGAACLVYVDGVKKTYTSDYTVNTSTKVLTFGAAPAAGAKVLVVYQFVATC